MRALWTLFFFLAATSLSAPVPASELGNLRPEKAPARPGLGERVRAGGDAFADAAVIPALPFADEGSTCGYANDYDEVCPYSGSAAPDVVYRYSPVGPETVLIELCASLYDTKVYVCADSPGQVVACNDDAGCGYSGYQSRIDEVALSPGHVYYIVIDGYSDLCGSYRVSVSPAQPCAVACPAGAPEEGEPACRDEYVDEYNGGCNGFGFTPLQAEPSGCAVMCGRACTYLGQGLSYRDTDWYLAASSSGTVTATCRAEFAVSLALVYEPDCTGLQYVMADAERCQPATVSGTLPPNTLFRLWVGPSQFSGVPESAYTLEVCGISSGPPPGLGACCLEDGACVFLFESGCAEQHGAWKGPEEDCSPTPCEPSPAERTSWGRIKASYRAVR